VFSNAEWTEISEVAGGLPAVARDEVTTVISAFRDDEAKNFEVRDSTTKISLKKALDTANELRKLLATFNDENYRCYNTKDEPLSVVALEQTRNVVAGLCQTLARDHERFKLKTRRDREKTRQKNLVRRLLEIQQHHLKTKLPVQIQETPTSGPFRRYIKRCSGFSDALLDDVLASVTKEFARRKKTAGD
jgi:hypothetical protein